MGGGCIELVIWVGETSMASSMVGIEVRVSCIGESRVVMYLGVRASDDAGGDIYCSTPINMGKV